MERGFLVGLKLKRQKSVWRAEDSLEELAQLARTAGIEVVGSTIQRLDRPQPATLIGKGKVEELKALKGELKPDVIIFDEELSPRQQRNLEEELDLKIVDRTALILDIFSKHARTHEGRLQVQLAQYEYRLPRLTRLWTHLARQVGGTGARGRPGGVGVRGPGETQLETDRREIGRRIAHLRQQLEEVRTHRRLYRRRRRRAGIPVVAIVGYTNAGKSTLLNSLAGSDILVEDKLFATLDPTTRRVPLPNGRVALFTDTVGFIQKLPTQLVAAFQATLEEIAEADLLLHILDITHPHLTSSRDRSSLPQLCTYLSARRERVGPPAHAGRRGPRGRVDPPQSPPAARRQQPPGPFPPAWPRETRKIHGKLPQELEARFEKYLI